MATEESRRVRQALKRVENERRNVQRIEDLVGHTPPGSKQLDRYLPDLAQQRAQLDFAILQLARARHEAS